MCCRGVGHCKAWIYLALLSTQASYTNKAHNINYELSLSYHITPAFSAKDVTAEAQNLVNKKDMSVSVPVPVSLSLSVEGAVGSVANNDHEDAVSIFGPTFSSERTVDIRTLGPNTMDNRIKVLDIGKIQMGQEGRGEGTGAGAGEGAKADSGGGDAISDMDVYSLDDKNKNNVNLLDLTGLEQLVEVGQTRWIGHCMKR